nr:RNA 2',3'-cyclic phosphodiesterase [Candidatus Woesearchaeota archaeon]
MRCFIAFDIPVSLKNQLEEIQKELYSENEKIKWVAKKNLHCTLKFLGNVDEIALKEIMKKLEEVNFKRFKIRLDKIGVFPSKNFIRVVFVELNPSKNVIDLQNEIDNKLLTMFPREKSFHSHLTLGRVKFVKDKEKFLKKIGKVKVTGEFEVSEFKLYKSVLSKDGPKYGVVKGYGLED